MAQLNLRAHSRFSLAAATAAVIVASALGAASPVSAQSVRGNHRARVSDDLSDHLSAGSQAIRVIAHGERSEMDALAARYNLRIARYLKSGAVFQLNAGQLEALRQDETQDHLSGDIRLRSSVDAMTAESIGADQVWAGSDELPGLSGAGVTVAVIDSGIDTRHAALRRRVIATRDFTGGDGIDRFGHGTHVAAIIAGLAGRTPETREQRGIAPGAYLLNLRVLGDDGSGSASDVIEAIDWTIEHRHEYNVRIINLSLGAPVLQPYRDDPLCEAVERAVRAGLVVVVAAGNYGRAADGRDVIGGIGTPGNSPFAITVGAVDTHGTAKRSDDTLAPYSAKGPTRFDLNVKPDVVAPGTRVTSAEAADSFLARTYPARHVAGSGANAYMQLSGTSMAAGVVSGTAALLLDGRPSLTPRSTKAVLQMTSTFLPSAGLIGAGAGLINARAAVELAKTNERPETRIAGEDVVASGIYSASTSAARVAVAERRFPNARQARGVSATTTFRGNAIIWGTETGDSIMWGTAAGDSIMWGTVASNQILWGTAVGDQILWGTATGDQILWGTSTGDQILWGTATGDQILWGTALGDQILWGTALGDQILWGTALGDQILWGTATGDQILWGTSAGE
jgi:serine protease AprX